jgi:hypothetical protein
MLPCALKGLLLVIPRVVWKDEVIDGLGKVHAFACIEDLAEHSAN